MPNHANELYEDAQLMWANKRYTPKRSRNYKLKQEMKYNKQLIDSPPITMICNRIDELTKRIEVLEKALLKNVVSNNINDQNTSIK